MDKDYFLAGLPELDQKLLEGRYAEDVRKTEPYEIFDQDDEETIEANTLAVLREVQRQGALTRRHLSGLVAQLAEELMTEEQFRASSFAEDEAG